ncbi:hypothetical protein Btru_001261 [Bulinus truncatus]|nr:hypothetical protein Btru_001261 [Bulinus truncatus]
MSTYHQQLWLIASVTVTDSIGSKFEQDFMMGILIRGGNGDSQSVEESAYNPHLSIDVHNRTRKLKCSGTNCDDLIVMHLGYLDFAYYYITVTFYDLNINKLSISNVKFAFKSYNPSFTQIEIWIRFVFLVFTFLTTTDRHFVRFYLPKVIIVGLIWLCAVTLASWQEYNELQDPTYYYRLDTTNFEDSLLSFSSFLDLRLKFMTALMIIVVSISITITVMRFGGVALQDNFVSELSTNYENSAEFVSFYGLLNFYMYTMAFVYSPSPNAMFETHFKDNPALSMLNDSDEEVHYSSDTEETSLSRTRNTLIDSDEETVR